MKKKFIFVFLFWVVVLPAMISGAITLLWNMLLPGILGLQVITFWQALGLFFLSQLLLGGFGIGLLVFAGMLHTIMHHRGGAHGRHMTDEQRREFFRRLRRSRFGDFDKRWNAEEESGDGSEDKA